MSKVDIGGLRTWWQSCDGCAGEFEAHAIINNMPHPICTMYFKFSPGPDIMHIDDIFTNYRYRRNGVAATVIRAVIDAYKPRYVVTGSESKEEAVEMMKKMGFIKSRQGVMKGHWILRTEFA